MRTQPAGSYLNVHKYAFQIEGGLSRNLGDQVQTEAKEFQSFQVHEHNSVRKYLNEISECYLEYSCTIQIIVHVNSAVQGYKH